MKRFVFILLLVLLISGCGSLAPVTKESATPTTSVIADTSTSIPPTQTPLPTATATVPPTPDPSSIGLPSEPAGTVAFDFVDQMCAAEWYSGGQTLPCPGDPSQTDTGYVMRLDGGVDGVPSGFKMMMTFPPLVHYSKIFSKYPPFTIKKGDRFRTVTACLADRICDVRFYLNFLHGNGERYLNRWHYLFTDEPTVIDYSLDSLAGETIQFDLAVVAIGGSPEMNAVWIAPHIYRPLP